MTLEATLPPTEADLKRRALVGCALGAALAFVVMACGESRHPIGEECLRDEDCLSNVCAARSCVSAPTLISGAVGAPDETPRLSDDAGPAPADAASEGS